MRKRESVLRFGFLLVLCLLLTFPAVAMDYRSNVPPPGCEIIPVGGLSDQCDPVGYRYNPQTGKWEEICDDPDPVGWRIECENKQDPFHGLTVKVSVDEVTMIFSDQLDFTASEPSQPDVCNCGRGNDQPTCRSQCEEWLTQGLESGCELQDVHHRFVRLRARRPGSQVVREMEFSDCRGMIVCEDGTHTYGGAARLCSVSIVE